MSNGVKKQDGFIAITSVLIISALILVLGVSIFHASLTDQAISSSYDSGEQASFLADFCAREALFKLKKNVNYVGDESIDISGMSCTINPIENINDYTKKISTLAKVGDRPHFKRAKEEIRYVVESKAENWICESCVIQNLEIIGNSLVLSEALEEGEPIETQGYRISSELDISGEGIVKDSQIFWQADTRLGASIVIETRFYNGETWTDWEAVINGREVPGLNRGTNLETALIQTRASFTGGPEFYPSLNNINIFVEIK